MRGDNYWAVTWLYSKTVTQFVDGAEIEAAQIKVERGVFDVISAGRLDDLDDTSQHVSVSCRRQPSLKSYQHVQLSVIVRRSVDMVML